MFFLGINVYEKLKMLKSIENFHSAGGAYSHRIISNFNNFERVYIYIEKFK